MYIVEYDTVFIEANISQGKDTAYMHCNISNIESKINEYINSGYDSDKMKCIIISIIFEKGNIIV